MIADKLAKKSKGAYPLVPAIAFLISAPCFILAMNSAWLMAQFMPGGVHPTQSLTLAFLIFLIPTGLNLAWLGPSPPRSSIWSRPRCARPPRPCSC
jgi:hypothetical protein